MEQGNAASRNRYIRPHPGLDPGPVKRCQTCRQSLPLAAFAPRTKGAQGVSAHCKNCIDIRYETGGFGCSRCGRTLPGSAFFKGHQGTAITQPCRECRSVAQKVATRLRQIEQGRSPYHLLSDINEMARTAVCRECGPTSICATGSKTGCGWRCAIRSSEISAARYDAQAQAAGANPSPAWHVIQDVRPAEMRATCSLCGDAPVRWAPSGGRFICASPARKSRNAALQRRHNRLKKYGLSEDDYERMNRDQDGHCAICGSDDAGRADSDAGLVVDHCHESNRVRGLLCKPCNTGLGAFRDAPELMQAAIKYLLQFATAPSAA